MKTFEKKHLAIVIGICIIVLAVIVTVVVLATLPHYDSEFHNIGKEQVQKIDENLKFLSDPFVADHALSEAEKASVVLDRKNVLSDQIKKEYIESVTFEYDKGGDTLQLVYAAEQKNADLEEKNGYQKETKTINGTQITFYRGELPENEAGLKGALVALFYARGYYIKLSGALGTYDLVESAVNDLTK